MPHEDDHALARRLATEAGHLLVELRERLTHQGAPRHVLKAAGDSQAHHFLMTELASARPGDAVLSEEGRDQLERLVTPRVWIVDPLDGTREFSEVPRADWAVHVALVEDGVPTAGAVSLPAENLTFSTEGEVPRPSPPSGPLRLLVSRTRPLLEAMVIAEELGGELLPMGSAGAKTMAVVRGQADIYAHAGGQYEWDSCAPVAVARAAGLHCTRLDGSELRYNRPDPWLPDLLICHPDAVEPVRRVLARIGW